MVSYYEKYRKNINTCNDNVHTKTEGYKKY